MTLRRAFTYLVVVVVAAGVVCLALYGYVKYTTAKEIYSSVDLVPKTQAALVLGASVTAGGALSAVLAERADEAIELYKAGKVNKILVTGDNATVAHNEVDPVGKYLVLNGIPKSDIFLDHAGFDTYSSMYRARDVFDVTSLTIVSQPFHLPRALFIARSLGLTAYGIDAGDGGWSYFKNNVREIPASIKAMGDLFITRIPKYLGQQYPITGDGSDTWSGYTDATTTATTTSKT